MAEFDYIGNPLVFPTPKANTNGSGSATFWDNSFKPVVDRTSWLKARSDTQFGVQAASTSRTISASALPISGTWSPQVTGLYQTGVITACVLNIPIPAGDMPNGVTLSSASVSILPAGHASISGLTLPNVALYSFDTVSGLLQIGATAPDTSATFSLYNLQHPLTVAGLAAIIDRTTKRYFLSFTSESGGANAAAGLLVVSASVVYVAL